jgi:hypothetical protein
MVMLNGSMENAVEASRMFRGMEVLKMSDSHASLIRFTHGRGGVFALTAHVWVTGEPDEDK